MVNLETISDQHPQTLTMEGVEGVRLRLMSLDDEKEIMQIAKSDPDLGIWQFWARDPFDVPSSVAQAYWGMTQDGWIQYRIVKEEPKEPIIGSVTLYKDRNHPERYNFAYWLTTPELHNGYATAGSRAVLEYAKTLGINEVALQIAEGNEPSRKLAGTLGAVPTENVYYAPTTTFGERVVTREWSLRLE